MKKLISKIKQFHNDEQGDIVQTGIIIGILAVLSVGGLVFLQPKLKAMFTKGGTELTTGAEVTY